MITFTFNLLDRFGVLEKAYLAISNTLNKHVLNRNFFNSEMVSDVFQYADSFWSKYGKRKWYNESEIRVIVGTIAESIRDNQLTSGEVRAIVNYVVYNWDLDVAKTKQFSSDIESVIPPAVENNVFRAVEIYGQIDTGKVSPEDFVSLGSRAISENFPDNKIVEGVLSALKLFK